MQCCVFCNKDTSGLIIAAGIKAAAADCHRSFIVDMAAQVRVGKSEVAVMDQQSTDIVDMPAVSAGPVFREVNIV